MKRNSHVQTHQRTLRNAADPFTLHLQSDPYILRVDDLTAQVDSRLSRKRTWFYPDIKVVSFANACLQLSLKHETGTFAMTIYLEPYKLHIACGCATRVETMCLHTYRALQQLLVGNSTDYFTQYRPNGWAEIAARYPHLFMKKTSKLGTEYIPKKSVGKVFLLSAKNGPTTFTTWRTYTMEPLKRVGERKVDLGYMVIISSREQYLPGLVSCSGVLNKAGDELKLFHPFLSGLPEDLPYVLTPDQQQLQRAGIEMWKWIERLPGTLSEVTEKNRSFLLALFSLWEAAVPLLHHQAFTYQYKIHRLSELRGRADKSYTTRNRVSKERPQLHFRLQYLGPYFLFWPVVTIRGVVHTQFQVWGSFFIMIRSELFLLASLRDATVLEWMEEADGILTIFKEHFPEFEKSILRPLQHSYTIAIDGVPTPINTPS